MAPVALSRIIRSDLSRWMPLAPKAPTRRTPSRISLAPTAAVLLSISLGLCGGYLDLLILFARKLYWKDALIDQTGRDFPWSVPVAHTVLLLIPGMILATICRLRLLSLRGVVAAGDAGDLGGPPEAAYLWPL